MCSANNHVHRTRRIVTLEEITWVTDGGMLYQIVEMNSTIDSKTSKMVLNFLS